MDLDGLTPTPWDAAALGVDTFEVERPQDEALLRAAAARPGHYSARIGPLESKALLQRHGFYYCDTLLRPVCTRERFRGAPDPRASVVAQLNVDHLVALAHGAFSHDRFHRDFHVDPGAANLRYDRWLAQLHREDRTFGIAWEGTLAAFFAVTDSPDGAHLVLHAVSEGFRGRGIAKHLWTAGCETLFARGHRELSSSVSAANLAVVNLYASLGFRFAGAVDLYHRFTPLHEG